MRRHRGLMFALVASLCVSGFAGSPAGARTRSTVPSTLPGNVLTELTTYWTQIFPLAFGIEFAALRGGAQGMDSGQTPIPGKDSGVLCIPDPAQIAGNMYYCPSADGIVYDTGVLVPVLLHHYGEPGLVASFAHEFGHAVAARVGVADGAAINIETQADCFAGNFLGWLYGSTTIPGTSPALSMTEPELLQAFQPLLDFRDQIDVKPTDAGAHGLGIDRAQAVLLGLRSDPVACRDISTDSISTALGRFAAAPTQPARYVDTDGVLAAAAESTEIGIPSAEDLQTSSTIGQFGLAVAAVLDAPGSNACAAGTWTASVYGSAPPGTLGSWLSDVDEGVDLIRYRPGATFADLTDFVDGFAVGCG